MLRRRGDQNQINFVSNLREYTDENERKNKQAYDFHATSPNFYILGLDLPLKWKESLEKRKRTNNNSPKKVPVLAKSRQTPTKSPPKPHYLYAPRASST